MKPRKDEQLQKMLDQGKVSEQVSHDPEMKAYQTLYQALAHSPEFTLPGGFSERVARRALQQRKRQAHRQSALLVGIMLLALLFSMLTLYYAYPPFFQFVLAYKELILFALVLFFAIQAADYWLVRKKLMHRWGW